MPSWLLTSFVALSSAAAVRFLGSRYFQTSPVVRMATSAPTQPEQWRAILSALPSTPDNIPSFYIAHGHPMWVWPETLSTGGRFGSDIDSTPKGRPATFLKDLGPILLEKYKPKAILVFSAHWEEEEQVVADWGDTETPLLYDYYGFDPAMYSDIHFRSKGNHQLSQRIVDTFKQSGINARLSGRKEIRGEDGRGFPGYGLDHGVFVPFMHMFPAHTSKTAPIFDIPVIQASISAALTPEANERIGRAVAKLRREGVLIISGGLTMHNLRDFSSFSEKTAKDHFKQWNQDIIDSVDKPTTPEARRRAMHALIRHPVCRLAHPRLEHFVPLYVALGAGEDGDAKVLTGLYGASSFVFGL